LAGLRTLLRIEVGNDQFASYCGRRNVHSATANAARADDHQVVVHTQMPTRLLECRKRGDA
jgi:hypothetical protein